MNIQNNFKISALAAAIIIAPFAMADEQSASSKSYGAPAERDIITSGSVREGGSEYEAMNENDLETDDGSLSDSGSGSRSQESATEMSLENRDDYLGVVSFEGKSTELTDSSRETLINISQEIDKSQPAELTVEVADAVMTMESETFTGESGQPTEDSQVSASGSRERMQSDGLSEMDVDEQSLYSASEEKTTDRAEKIKTYLQQQGLNIQNLTIESSEDTTATITNSEQSQGSLAIASGQKVQPKSQGKAGQIQKVRIVITEV